MCGKEHGVHTRFRELPLSQSLLVTSFSLHLQVISTGVKIITTIGADMFNTSPAPAPARGLTVADKPDTLPKYWPLGGT